MLPEITLVAGTVVDWPKFVTGVNNALGRSPTRGLDDYALPVGSPASYVAALAEFNHAGSNPVTAVKEADRTFAHLSFTFLVSADQSTTLAILKQSIGLIVTSAEPSRGRENLLISGSLRDWRAAIVESCAPMTPPETRTFFNQVWTIFEKLGFRDVFAAYQRRELKDNTFILEARKK